MRYLIFTVVCGLACMLGACGPISFTIGAPPAGKIASTVVATDPGMFVRDKVAVIDVTGLIVNASVPGILSTSENPVGLLHEKLAAAERDPAVKAVILRINSPGGTVTATDAMYREVERFRETTGKPVIALMMDVAASGGYYLACSADHVIAYPTTITGSIGVIVQTFSVRGTLDKIGVSAEAITSGPNKDIGSPFSRLSPEERQIFQELVDDFFNRFTGVVKLTRPAIAPDKFAMVTDGRIFSGADAAELGLVDATGDLYDAFANAKAAAGVNRAKLVVYHRQGAMGPRNIYAESPAPMPHAGSTQINLAQFNLDTRHLGDASMTFLYLWQP